MEQWNTS